MIPSGVEVFVGLAPIDLRWGFDRLAGAVQERIGRDVRIPLDPIARSGRTRSRVPEHPIT